MSHPQFTPQLIRPYLSSPHQNSVVLDDKRLSWRVVVEAGGYYRVGPKVDPFTLKKVEDLLNERAKAKEEKEYEVADKASLTRILIILL